MERIRLLIGLLIAAIALGGTVHAQGAITATGGAELLPDLPRRVQFTVEASSSEGDITEARLFFQPMGASVRISEQVAVSPSPSVSLSYDWNMQQNGAPPGTTVEFFWRLADSAGNQFETEPQEIVALDPRFDWQTLADEELAIHWYDADPSWGQEMFDTGKEALAQLESELGTDVTERVTVVAYSSDPDFVAAFPPQQDWIGGQAFTHLGVSVQIIRPGDRSWMRTVIFHELSHLVFAQATEGAVALVPAWLEEGLAMYNEPEGRDSAYRVEQAAQQDDLLPFSHLQGNFGADGEVVGIAYAQSEMLVTYLLEECGREGFQQVISNLTEESMSVDRALEAACGYDSQALYDDWRQTLPNAPDIDSAPAINTEPPPPDATVVEEADGSRTGLLMTLAALAACVGGLAFAGILAVGWRLLRANR